MTLEKFEKDFKTKIKIDRELKSLIPPLQDEERELLKKNIEEEGEIREPILVSYMKEDKTDLEAGTIIDGHNRFEIGKELDLEIPVSLAHVNTREEAILFIIENQLGRRNLTDYDRAQLGIKRAELLKPKADANRGGWKGNQYTKPEEAESATLHKQPIDTVQT